MTKTSTFENYIKNEIKEQEEKNKDIEYDDYSIVIDIDYTTQD